MSIRCSSYRPVCEAPIAVGPGGGPRLRGRGRGRCARARTPGRVAARAVARLVESDMVKYCRVVASRPTAVYFAAGPVIPAGKTATLSDALFDDVLAPDGATRAEHCDHLPRRSAGIRLPTEPGRERPDRDRRHGLPGGRRGGDRAVPDRGASAGLADGQRPAPRSRSPRTEITQPLWVPTHVSSRSETASSATSRPGR